MKKWNQFHKGITAPLEQMDWLRNSLPIAFALLGIACFLIEDATPIGFVFFAISACFGIVWLLARKYYNQIVLLQDRIQVYTRGGKLKRELLFSDFKISRQIVVLNERLDTKCDALIFYRNTDLYEGMILREHLSDKNVLIITNREAIAAIEEQLNPIETKACVADAICDRTEPIAAKNATIPEEQDKQYSLLSKDSTTPPLMTKKYILFLVGCVCVPLALAFVDTIYLLMLIIPLVLVVYSVLLHFSPLAYQRYAVVLDDRISVYSRKGVHMQDFCFSDVRAVKRSVFATGFHFAHEEECVILYRGTSPLPKESFSKYQKDKNVLYISNPELIERLDDAPILFAHDAQ